MRPPCAAAPLPSAEPARMSAGDIAQALYQAERALANGTPPAFAGLRLAEARRRAFADSEAARAWAGWGPGRVSPAGQLAGLAALAVAGGLLVRKTPGWPFAWVFGAAGGFLLGLFVLFRGRKRRAAAAGRAAMEAAYGTAESAGILEVYARFEKLYTELNKLKDSSAPASAPVRPDSLGSGPRVSG